MYFGSSEHLLCENYTVIIHSLRTLSAINRQTCEHWEFFAKKMYFLWARFLVYIANSYMKTIGNDKKPVAGRSHINIKRCIVRCRRRHRRLLSHSERININQIVVNIVYGFLAKWFPKEFPLTHTICQKHIHSEVDGLRAGFI